MRSEAAAAARVVGCLCEAEASDMVTTKPQDAREEGRPTLRPRSLQGKLILFASVLVILLTSFAVATALEIVTFQSDDHREALAAMREKRPPRFQGR